jgi:hypothetical protein
MGRFLTLEALRLGLTGLAVGLAVGLAWGVVGRRRWGAAPFPLAVLVAARLADRSDWPHWDAHAAVGAILSVLAGVGAARLLADPAAGQAGLAAGALISAAGVYAGVPETGPALLVGGGLTGLAVSAALTRARWAPAAGAGVAVVVGWAALSGAAGRPWAAVGGALCTGIAPWFAFRRLLPTSPGRWGIGPWSLGAHAALVIIAARWVGVVPHAGWLRVAAVAAGGFALAAVTNPEA